MARVSGAARRTVSRAVSEPSGARRLAGGGVDRAHLRSRVPLPRPARCVAARARPPRGRVLRRVDRGRDRGDGVASPRVADADRSGRDQGRRVDLSVPLRHGHSRDRADGLPQSDGGAGARAAGSIRRDARAAVPAGDRHRARELEPLPLRPAAPATPRAHHGADARVLGRARPAGAARAVRADVGEGGARARACTSSTHPGTCRTWRSRARWPTPSSRSVRRRRGRGEVLLLPPDAVRHGPRRALVVGDALQPLLRPEARAAALQRVPRPARVRGASRLGRAVRERAPPELLRDDAEPERHGGHARAPHHPREDRDPRQRAPAPREPAAHRRGSRDARRGVGRPRDLGLRARDQRGVLLHRRQSDALARPLLRGRRADPARVDGAGALRLRREVLPLSLRQSLAAPAAAAPPARVVSVAGQHARPWSGRPSAGSRT